MKYNKFFKIVIILIVIEDIAVFMEIKQNLSNFYVLTLHPAKNYVKFSTDDINLGLINTTNLILKIMSLNKIMISCMFFVCLFACLFLISLCAHNVISDFWIIKTTLQ